MAIKTKPEKSGKWWIIKYNIGLFAYTRVYQSVRRKLGGSITAAGNWGHYCLESMLFTMAGN